MKLYVGNLPFSLGEDELKKLFGEYGEVTDATIIIDRLTGKPRGFAFVTMGSDSGGQQAIQSLNGKEIEGRPLTVNEARPQRSNNDRGGDRGFSRRPRKDY